MSLLLYDQHESIPESSRARKFLTSEFRESVADQLNSLLLTSEDSAKTPPRVSARSVYEGPGKSAEGVFASRMPSIPRKCCSCN